MLCVVIHVYIIILQARPSRVSPTYIQSTHVDQLSPTMPKGPDQTQVGLACDKPQSGLYNPNCKAHIQESNPV
jgi:hypothetical protein